MFSHCLASSKMHNNERNSISLVFNDIREFFENRSFKVTGLLFPLLLVIFLNQITNNKIYNPKSRFPNKFVHNGFDRLIHRREILRFVGLGCINESIDQGRFYYQKEINISMCSFSMSSVFSGNGAVIYVSGGTFSIDISYSMFYNCACSQSGGSIYFSSSNSNLRMICANSCACGASYGGHFSYLVASQTNQMEYISVAFCSHSTSGYHSVYLKTGYQRVDNTNSSMNNAYLGSGICIESPSSFLSTHCTLSNNIVSYSICIDFYSNSGTLSSANIVHNNSPSRGVIYISGGSSKMEHCIIQNNQNTLFNIAAGTLEISHSLIDHSGKFSTSTSVSTSNNITFTKTITYQIHFYQYVHCKADIPLNSQTTMNTIGQTRMRIFPFLYPAIILMFF